MRCALRGPRRAGLAGDGRRARLRRRGRPGAGEQLSAPEPADPFGTAALRAAVLDAWAASPTRFREDANAEEDLVIGGYADAWFVELAQNAADAAGAGGRVRVSVVDGELRVANTGAALTADGVAALAALRASAKRDDHGSVGRFGVGFAAVLGVTDAPRVVSATGGIAFSAARTAAAVAELPAAAAELARRGAPPVLRLCWPTDERPPAGYPTEVRLPVRAGLDSATLLDQVRTAAPDLLLALPGLVEIDVAGTVLRREPGPGPADVTIDGQAWRLARAAGVLAPELRDTASEQRERAHWSVTWALPITADGTPLPLEADVVHAPTPTTERLALPARLIATLPLEPDRRRVRPGAATDAVLDGVVAAYLDLVTSVAPVHRTALVPRPGFPLSSLHDDLRERLLDGLRRAVWCPAAGGGELAPARAELLDLPGAGPHLGVLLAEAGWDALLAPIPDASALATLGVHRVSAAELVERLFGLHRPGRWWHALYTELAGLADTVPGLLDDLRALPVPLTGGRTAAGPATVLIGGLIEGADQDPIARLALPGLHVVEPDAVHPLLRRLGAQDAELRALLDHPAVREAVDRSLDDAEAGLDTTELAEAVLAVVAAVGEAPAAFGALALPDAHGDPARADELMLPDAALRPLLADDVPVDIVDPALAARVSRSALVAIGVLDGFGVLVDDEPVGPDHDLDDEDTWWDAVGAGVERTVAVRDLDLVADDAWPAALALLAGDRDTRAAVLAPGSYAGWWLARHARLGGHRPGHWRLGSATALAALYDPLPGCAAIDEPFLTAIGVLPGLDGAVADRRAAADLLARLADPARTPDAGLTSAGYAALADAVASGALEPADLDPPERVRALDGAVADADVAVVLDAPWLAPVLPPHTIVVGGDPAALAELLDLPLASEVVAGEVDGAGTDTPWSALPEVVVACATLGVPVPADTVTVHDELFVTLQRPARGRHRVPTWRDADGTWHAADPVRALLAHIGRAGASGVLGRCP